MNPGDHICAIYRSDDELASVVAEFLAEGAQKGERCWYLPADDDPARVSGALNDRAAAGRQGAILIASTIEAYAVRGNFDPEDTMTVFSDAIEQALADGFTGFRAAANMSWALELENGVERLITYEALLRSLFSTARATGLCLYDARRMPLQVIDGALCTHPVVRTSGAYRRNPFYDRTVRSLADADASAGASKLAHIDGAAAGDA